MTNKPQTLLAPTVAALFFCAFAVRAEAGSDALQRASARAQQISDTAKGFTVTPPAPQPPVCSSGQLQPVDLGGTEQLVYKVDVLGAELGTFELRLEPAKGEDKARGALVLESRGKSSDLVTTNVKRVEGWTSTLLDKDGMPLRYREEIDEGDVHRAQDIEFPSKAGALTVRATKNGDPDPLSIAATPDARDMLSGLFVLRRQPLTPGARLCAEIYAARRMWRVDGTVADKVEMVDSPLGKVQAIRLDAVATRLDDARVVRKAHVWVTTDERRLPVVILGEIRGRYIRAQLAEARVGRARLKRAAAAN